MGLDMYLEMRTYVGAKYEHRNVKGKIELTEGEDDKPIPIKLKRISQITEEVGYWRKANHIHKWFVENVQGGEDDCQDYHVGAEQLMGLLKECKKIQANKDKAEDLLPTTSGFFFGGTDYDEYYFRDIDYTIEMIESLMKEKNKKGFLPGIVYYTSSW